MSGSLKQLESETSFSTFEDRPHVALQSANFHVDEPRDPLWNMACDTWMATSAQLTAGTGLFRVYRWNPAGLTIGANQRWERALDISALSPGEIAVRRFTGGRAIYHDTQELTYAVAIELKELGPALVNALSHSISSGIMRFLEAQGLTPEITSLRKADPLNRGKSSRHCFESLTRHEITVNGRKVAAGAQRVFASRYFQHGSIKLAGAEPHPALFGPSALPSAQRSGELRPPSAGLRETEQVAKLMSLSEFLAGSFGVAHRFRSWTSEEENAILAGVPRLETRRQRNVHMGELEAGSA